MEKRYIRKDGNDIWVDLSVSSIRDNNGDTKASIGMISRIFDPYYTTKPTPFGMCWTPIREIAWS
jgi:hypothetical protein